MSDDDYKDFLLEDVRGKLDAILEGQVAMAYVPAKLESMDIRLISIESEVKAIRMAVTDRDGLIKNHEVRIVNLETAA